MLHSNQSKKCHTKLTPPKFSLTKSLKKRDRTQTRKTKTNQRQRTLKMRFLLVDSKASPPRKWMFHTSTITTAAAASTCATYVNGRGPTLTDRPISSPPTLIFCFSSVLITSRRYGSRFSPFGDAKVL